ncbi:MAG: acetylornithine deacetylase/succinyl-diaminopimelate desuccinylase-like protein [Myxococcota bacterium]|jgi:acetylornithine deacetylase/succinyl-diaminopimelate desuccinylase-like protein
MTPRAIPATDPAFSDLLRERFSADVADAVALSATLCAIPGITVPASKANHDAVGRTFTATRAAAEARGLSVTAFEADETHPYPFLVIGFAAHDLEDPAFTEAVGFIGHIDVVPPREDGQFQPVLRGEDLCARGAADMKTVVASWIVWMDRLQRAGGPLPPVLMLISCCEENGSDAPHHSESVLTWLQEERGVKVRFGIVGERTGELEWMDAPRVGPICKENRSWRWLRLLNPQATGSLDLLAQAAGLVGALRGEVARLNAEEIPAEKASRQPGVRSGLVSPYVLLPADPLATGSRWLQVRRPPGAAIHAAAAKASAASLVERFAEVAAAARERFPGARLGGLRIGQDGNFNSTDGSGKLWLDIDAEDDELLAWAAGLGADEMVFTILPAIPKSITPLMGLDIRELLDHQAAVLALIEGIPARMPGWQLERVNDRPAWRCPATQPDLVALEAAYAEVIGEPSPDLVKLHGNDGGSLAELVHRADPVQAAAGTAPAVVFGQVGKHPHGKNEFHRCSSIQPYWDILDRWAALIC